MLSGEGSKLAAPDGGTDAWLEESSLIWQRHGGLRKYSYPPELLCSLSRYHHRHIFIGIVSEDRHKVAHDCEKERK